jgi:Cu/Ag efflux protein CusF
MRLWIAGACLLIGLCVAGCQRVSVTTDKEAAKDEAVRRYALHGEVLVLDPQGKIAKIKHQKIGDWMEAMTMEFPVKEPADFAKLREGEKISGTVFVSGTSYWVGEIQEDTATPPAASK